MIKKKYEIKIVSKNRVHSAIQDSKKNVNIRNSRILYVDIEILFLYDSDIYANGSEPLDKNTIKSTDKIYFSHFDLEGFFKDINLENPYNGRKARFRRSTLEYFEKLKLENVLSWNVNSFEDFPTIKDLLIHLLEGKI